MLPITEVTWSIGAPDGDESCGGAVWIMRSIADAARMIDDTGCAGIAIGRGALANPWIFRQLSNWVETGEPGPRASYSDRIDFMRLHLRRLVQWKGDERNGCMSSAALPPRL